MSARDSGKAIWAGYPPLRSGALTPFWAQEASGIDFVRSELSHQNDFSQTQIGIVDSGGLSLGFLPTDRILYEVISGEEFLRSLRNDLGIKNAHRDSFSHATSDVNIMLSPISGSSMKGILSDYIFAFDNDELKLIGSDRSLSAQMAASKLFEQMQRRRLELLSSKAAVVNISVLFGSISEVRNFSFSADDRRELSNADYLAALRDGVIPWQLADFYAYRSVHHARILVFGIGNWSPHWLKRSAHRIRSLFSNPRSNAGLQEFGILVGSLAPTGKISDFSYGGATAPDIVAPVDLDLATVYNHQPEVLRTATHVSSAAAFVSGHEADIVSILGRLPLKEARLLLNRTAIRSEDGALLLNAYRQMRVALRLREKDFSLKPERERMALLNDHRLYDFSKEAEDLWLTMAKCDPKELSTRLRLARRSYLLDPTSVKALEISQLYQALGRSLNSEFYLSFARALSVNNP